jgi:GTP cyclohydrolase I
MSRMVTLVHEQLQRLDPQELPRVLKEGAALLYAPALTIAATMPFATQVTAPASGKPSWQVHEITLEGHLDGAETKVTSSVTTEVTSLCPCSKAISDYGAHNQRSQITLSVTGHGDTPYPLCVREALKILCNAGSAPIVPLVKRPDERVLTMQAYDHPVFVEDMARHITLVCRAQGLSHAVRIKNLESIHSHDAVAAITYQPATER